jgi:hypothetical protein
VASRTSVPRPPGAGMTTYRPMREVLRLLGNGTLVFVGDSIGSQHAHAMECSWWVLGGNSRGSSVGVVQSPHRQFICNQLHACSGPRGSFLPTPPPP